MLKLKTSDFSEAETFISCKKCLNKLKICAYCKNKILSDEPVYCKKKTDVNLTFIGIYLICADCYEGNDV